MNGKRKKFGPANNETPPRGWEIVYSGFILIMLCFFVLLTSYTSMEEGKIARFVQSFGQAVSIFSGGLKSEPGKEALNPLADIVDMESEISKILEELKTVIKSLGLEKDVSFSASEKGFVMRLSDTVLFDIGVAGISPAAAPLLKKIGVIISKTSYPIRIEGHTDNVPINTSRFPSNWELSTARAVNVLRYFIEKEKMSMGNLSAVGYGEFQPLFPNDSPEHRARNRRVEIVFAKKKEK